MWVKVNHIFFQLIVSDISYNENVSKTPICGLFVFIFSHYALVTFWHNEIFRLCIFAPALESSLSPNECCHVAKWYLKPRSVDVFTSIKMWYFQDFPSRGSKELCMCKQIHWHIHIHVYIPMHSCTYRILHNSVSVLTYTRLQTDVPTLIYYHCNHFQHFPILICNPSFPKQEHNLLPSEINFPNCSLYHTWKIIS
jgi:hypothetical protein